ncbi:KRAB [Mytilus edulis]|uniref:KRAB n=1 Tax=Mytilus edulis TaxID=6550 RepID=A0A8S3T1G9_MYTED|nr:KRAB [Mytilus edulis]
MEIPKESIDACGSEVTVAMLCENGKKYPMSESVRYLKMDMTTMNPINDPERPHIYEKCSKPFVKKVDLTRHMEYHTEPTNENCNGNSQHSDLTNFTESKSQSSDLTRLVDSNSHQNDLTRLSKATGQYRNLSRHMESNSQHNDLTKLVVSNTSNVISDSNLESSSSSNSILIGQSTFNTEKSCDENWYSDLTQNIISHSSEHNKTIGDLGQINCLNSNERLDTVETGTESSHDSDLNTTETILEEVKRPLYLCTTCKRTFPDSNRLQYHVKYHHTVTEHNICGICDKIFSCTNSLRRHALLHKESKEQDFAYNCNYCSKRFWNKSDLQKHTRTHTGDKPFICKICQKAFARDGNLNVHMRKHTGEKPYECNSCDEKFTYHSGLKYHKMMRCHKTTRVKSVSMGGSSLDNKRTYVSVACNTENENIGQPCVFINTETFDKSNHLENDSKLPQSESINLNRSHISEACDIKNESIDQAGVFINHETFDKSNHIDNYDELTRAESVDLNRSQVSVACNTKNENIHQAGVVNQEISDKSNHIENDDELPQSESIDLNRSHVSVASNIKIENTDHSGIFMNPEMFDKSNHIENGNELLQAESVDLNRSHVSVGCNMKNENIDQLGVIINPEMFDKTNHIENDNKPSQAESVDLNHGFMHENIPGVPNCEKQLSNDHIDSEIPNFECKVDIGQAVNSEHSIAFHKNSSGDQTDLFSQEMENCIKTKSTRTNQEPPTITYNTRSRIRIEQSHPCMTTGRCCLHGTILK